MKLTAKRVLKFLKQPGRYADGRGLYLQVTSSAAASWVLRYERDGRERMMGLGAVADFSLKEARDRAKTARQLLADGIDPLEARRAERERRALEAARAVTFKQCALQYFEAHVGEWSSADHRRQFMASLRTHAFPTLASISVAAITEPMVLAVLRPIWATKTVTAKRVRNRIAAVLDYATASKYRTGDNPAKWEGNLEHLLAAPEKISKSKPHEALPYTEVAEFLAELRAVEGIPARALEFLILTAARRDEVVGAPWDEIDLEAKTWIIPAERMKPRREHRVPLSDRAIEILRALPREPDNPHVFVGARPGHAMSPPMMLRELRELRSKIDVHGFRATFSSWASEQTSYPSHVIELSLSHAVGGAVERTYKREADLFERRRRLMVKWAEYCGKPKVTVKPKATDNVVTIHGEAVA